MKKLLMIVFTLAIVVVISGSVFALTLVRGYSLEELSLSIVKPETDVIPSTLSKFYLTQIRKTSPEEINQQGALQFVLNMVIESEPSNEKAFALADFLIEHGANINRIDPESGYSPLHAAVLANSPESVSYLVSKGADITVRDARNALTPLEFARKLETTPSAEPNRTQIIQLLSK